MFDELRGEVLNRRSLLRSAGGFALGAGTLGLLAGCGGSSDDNIVGGGTNNDASILNFALNLEYLEAEYYLRAIDGTGLSAANSGNTGRVTGGSAVNFTTPAVAQYAREIANDEQAHVLFLRSALGSSAVGKPNIDLGEVFTNAAIAAGVIAAGETFNPYENETNFLIGAFIFEDVGVTVYKGAAPLLTNKTYLEAAAGILAVEAYHAATVRTLLYQAGAQDVVQKISDLRDSVDSGSDLDQGIVVAGRANIVPTDENGIAFSRDGEQVINIVTLNGANNKGGFFPDGLVPGDSLLSNG